MAKRIILGAVALLLVIASAYASFYIAPEERTMGMVMLRVMAREKKMPMKSVTMPRATKTMRAVKDRFFASV